MTRLKTFLLFILLSSFTSEAFAGQLTEAGEVDTFPSKMVPGAKLTIRYANDSWKKEKVFVHFGFNGWNEKLEGTGAGVDDDNYNVNYFKRLPLSKGSDGKWDIKIDIPTTARALHFVFCKNTCSKKDWDNNNKQDFHRSAVFPFIGPYINKSKNTYTITFVNDVPKASTLVYWKKGGIKKYLKNTKQLRHRYRLENLIANSEYSYQINSASGEVLATKAFMTLPSSKSDPLNFIVLGDIQDDGEKGKFSQVVDRILDKHADYPLIVSPGDLAWDDTTSDWWVLFDKAKDLFAQKVFLATAGNHDTPTYGNHPDLTSFRYYFDFDYADKQQTWYRVSAGAADFLFLNSNIANDFKESGRQTEWIEKNLEHKLNLWTFALWHVPPFNMGSRHYWEQKNYRRPTQDFSHKIDWFFGGHEHLYQRMKPLIYSQNKIQLTENYGNQVGQGVGYLIVPSAGVAPNQRLSNNESLFKKQYLASNHLEKSRFVGGNIGYSTVSILNKSIRIQTWSIYQDQPIDRTAYSKE